MTNLHRAKARIPPTTNEFVVNACFPYHRSKSLWAHIDFAPFAREPFQGKRYRRRGMNPTKFDLWYQEFISSPQGEGAFMALEDLMGDHPE